MKNNSRLIALLLAVFLLVTAAACAAGGTEETSAEPETASTSAPETTDNITEKTTEEPYVSAVAPPETTIAETLPPEAEDVLHVLVQDGKGEAIISILASEEDRPLLDEREARLLGEHSLTLKLSKTADIVDRIKNGVLTGNNNFDLLLLNSRAGCELLTLGALEAVSEAGISITPESEGVHRKITESLTVGGDTYLFACDALVSDLTAVNAVRYDGTKLSSDPVTQAVAGDFTLELLLSYLSELTEDSLAIDQSASLAVFSAVGGEIFVKNEKGIPLSSLAEDKDFAENYSLAAELLSCDSHSIREAVFSVTQMTVTPQGSIFLPLPKADADSEYISLVDSGSISLFAAPLGVVDGQRLSRLLTAFNLSSSDYREAVRLRLTEQSGVRGEKMLTLIERSARLDLGIMLGWGDIDDLIAEGLASGTSAKDLLSDRITSMRNEAVETAAKIVAERLNIE